MTKVVKQRQGRAQSNDGIAACAPGAAHIPDDNLNQAQQSIAAAASMQTALLITALLALAFAQSEKPLVTLDRNPAALDWKTWLKGSEATGARGNAPPRRITTKSLFIAPQRDNMPMCAEGYRPDDMGRCVKVVRVDESAHNNFLLDKLNSQFASQLPDNSDFSYDYSEDPVDVSSGPFQLNIPISLQAPTGADSPHDDTNNVTAVNVPQATDSHQVDKKDVMQADQSVRNETLVQQLESLKAESLVSVVDSSFGLNHGNHTKDNLAEDTTAKNSDNLDSNENIRDMINLDTNYIDNKSSETNLTSVNKLTESKNDSLIIDILPRINGTGINFLNDTRNHDDRNATTIDASDKDSKKNATLSKEKITSIPTLQNLPHPEIDYSDLGEALKIMSRFAEVSTDEMFSDEHRSGQINSEEDQNPLGTRTKLQHRKKQSSKIPPVQSRESLDLPTYEIPPNKLRGQTTFRFPNGVSASSNLRGNFDEYNWPNLRPEPPMDLRSIMNFWPQQQYPNLNGQHVNPTRHRHSYLYPGLSHSGGERIRQAAPVNYRWPRQSLVQHPAPSADLYNILGMRHWLRNREGGDER